MKLHADDLGLNEVVNQKSSELLKKGKLVSVSLLANMPYTKNACKILRQYNSIPVFLHFNLIEGTPLSSNTISNLIGDDGAFCNRNKLVTRILFGKVTRDEIRYELSKQLDTLQKLGITISGIDSHQHMHALSPIGEIVVEEAQKRKLSYIRSFNQMQNHSALGYLKSILFKIICSVTYLKTYKKLGLPETWKINKWKNFSVASWDPIIAGTISNNEVVVFHPGLPFDKVKLV